MRVNHCRKLSNRGNIVLYPRCRKQQPSNNTMMNDHECIFIYNSYIVKLGDLSENKDYVNVILEFAVKLTALFDSGDQSTLIHERLIDEYCLEESIDRTQP